MKLLAGLMFNRTRVILQTVYVSTQTIILSLQQLHLLLQRPSLLPFMQEDRNSVVAEDYAIRHAQGQNTNRHGSRLAPPTVDTFARGPSDRHQARNVFGLSIDWHNEALL
jgi:hypothetical protein